MQELAREISNVVDHEGAEAYLRSAAVKWAAHCLETYNGDLLKAGLAISESIAIFLNEYESASDEARGD